MKVGFASGASGAAGQISDVGVGLASVVWGRARAALKSEMSEDTFGSWVAPACVHEDVNGAVVLVTPTGIARDWIRRNAWRRVTELWGQHDPLGRMLDLQSKVDFEAGRPVAARPVATDPSAALALAEPASSDLVAPPVVGAGSPARMTGLQERFTFDTFVSGPANEFAYASGAPGGVLSDGHFLSGRVPWPCWLARPTS